MHFTHVILYPKSAFSIVLPFYVISCIFSDDSFQKSKNSPDSAASSANMSNESSTKNEQMALVLYDDSKVLHMYRDKRIFTFGQHEVVINQDWRGGGVAAIVWDAAIVLGEFLIGHPDLVKGRRVLELGAGTGLVGIVAAKLGGSVEITDREVALESLRKNVESNSLELEDGTHANVKIKELDWGSNHQQYTGSYDIILGADIIYIEETFEQLLQTILFLCKPKTVILLSCRIRYERDERFLNMLRSHLKVQKVFYDKSKDIHVYRVKASKLEL